MKNRCCTLLFLLFCLPAFPLAAAAQAKFTQIDFPGAVTTYVFGIDTAGDMVGYYIDATSVAHGFLLSNGNFTTIDAPAASYTYAVGINDRGQIAGGSSVGGFIYDVSTSTFTIRTHPGYGGINAQGINNSGTVVGTAFALNRAKRRYTGFELEDGTLSPLPPFPEVNSYANAINNAGDVVGDTSRNPPFYYSSFVCRQGSCQTILGGIKNPQAYGINDADEIVGGYTPDSGQVPSGFVCQNGVVKQLQVPGQNGTFALGVNNEGEVVGFYVDTDAQIHGFIWIPAIDAHQRRTAAEQ